jgi:hypothetical protein
LLVRYSARGADVINVALAGLDGGHFLLKQSFYVGFDV